MKKKSINPGTVTEKLWIFKCVSKKYECFLGFEGEMLMIFLGQARILISAVTDMSWWSVW